MASRTSRRYSPTIRSRIFSQLALKLERYACILDVSIVWPSATVRPLLGRIARMHCVNAPLSYTCRSVVGTLAGNAVFWRGRTCVGPKLCIIIMEMQIRLIRESNPDERNCRSNDKRGCAAAMWSFARLLWTPDVISNISDTFIGVVSGRACKPLIMDNISVQNGISCFEQDNAWSRFALIQVGYQENH